MKSVFLRNAVFFSILFLFKIIYTPEFQSDGLNLRLFHNYLFLLLLFPFFFYFYLLRNTHGTLIICELRDIV